MFRKLLAAATTFVVGTLCLAQIDPQKTVAVVNGEAIKADEYYHRMEFLPGVGKRVGDRYAEFTPGFMTIEHLITERLILQMAKQKNCLPTDAEVEAELAQVKAANPKIVDQWTASGRTVPELMLSLKVNVAQFKLRTFGINITDLEVEDHYKKNPSMYTQPKRARLRVIAVPDATTRDKAQTALAGGKAFPEVAKEMSIDITKVEGGLVGVVPIASLNETFRNAVNAIKIGQTTDWISSEGRFVKFLLEDIAPERLVPLDANLKVAIRRRLMLDRGAVKNNISKEMAEMRAKSTIDIKNPEFAEVYKRYVDADLAEEKAKAGGAKP